MISDQLQILPSLANQIHTADVLLHDNTYKWVFGNWKEWEVMIWDKKLNMSEHSFISHFVVVNLSLEMIY